MIRRKDKTRTMGLFGKSLISYTSVLLLPILICSFYYVHSYNALKERTAVNQHLALENYGEHINTAFRDASNLGSHLQLNKYVTALSNNEFTAGSSPYMDRYYLQKHLNALQVSNALMQCINIYFPGSDYVVNTTSTFQMSLLPYMEAKSNTMCFEDWEHILSTLRKNQIIAYANPDKNFITVSRILSNDISGNPSAVLCIQIDKKNLSKYLQNQLLADYPCDYVVINEYGILLSAFGSEAVWSDLSTIDILAHFEQEDCTALYETTARDTRLIIDSYPLQINHTALLSIAERKYYYAPMTQLLEIMIFTILICILIGLAVVTYYSRKSYEPVSEILHFIREADSSIEPRVNEYHIIMQMLTQNRNEIERQRELLKNNYMQKIFSGEIALSQVPTHVAEQFSISLSSSLCIVLLSTVKGYVQEDASDSPGLHCFIIKNVFEELLSEEFPNCFFSYREQQITVLINFSPNMVQPLLSLSALVEKLNSFLESTFDLPIMAGISSLQPPDCIPNAFFQANTALEYLKLFELGSLCLYDTIPQKQIIGTIPLNTTDYVRNLVFSGNHAGISEYFSVIQKELEKNELSWSDAKSCYYFFYQSTAKLQLYCQTHFGFQVDALHYIEQDFFTLSLPKALSLTYNAYLLACSEIADKKVASSNAHWGDDICKFIDNNYFDGNINLNTIAAHFNLSPAYLSKKFREQYKMTVIDYLYKVRISNAIPLLNDTNLKIADIAQMTGFIDSNAFIRIFKKVKGTTPGKYKSDILTGDSI